MDGTGPYAVRAIVQDDMTSDRGAFFTETELVYTVDGGAEQTVPLSWMGHDLYRAEIPGQPSGSTIAYRATATDFAGNSGMSLEESFQVGQAPQFDRGDCNADGNFDLADAIKLLDYLFPPPGTTLDCFDACDGNDDENLNIADAISILATLFPSGPPVDLPPPFGSCGEDPAGESLGCEVHPCP
jgi:hypothetical protein